MEKGFLAGFLVLGFVLFILGFLVGMLLIGLISVRFDSATLVEIIIATEFIKEVFIVVLIAIIIKLMRNRKETPVADR